MRSKESYAVAVRREFTAQHYLIGGDWGVENQLHEHHYAVEIRLEGRQLDRHGYLIDIDVVTAQTTNKKGRVTRASPSESGKANSPGPNIEKSSDAGRTGDHR